jgi:hypothetical protein
LEIGLINGNSDAKTSGSWLINEYTHLGYIVILEHLHSPFDFLPRFNPTEKESGDLMNAWKALDPCGF